MIDESGLLWILLAILLVGQYAIYPISFFLSHRSRIPELVPVDGEPETTDPESERLIGEVAQFLATRGFEVAGHFTHPPQPAVTSRVTLLVNEEESVGAVLASVRGPGMLTRFVEYSTEFVDGTRISTSNSPVAAGTLAPRPETRSLQFPDVTDPLELYELHAASIARDKSSTEKVGVARSTAKAEFLEAYRKVLEHQVTQGLLRTTSQPGTYSATLRGAFLMVWKNAIPVGAIRRFLMRRRMSRERMALAKYMPG